MIEKDKNGHRSGSVARGATRQVASRKTGVRLTWILPPLRVERICRHRVVVPSVTWIAVTQVGGNPLSGLHENSIGSNTLCRPLAAK